MSSASADTTACFFASSSSASNAQKRPLSVRVDLQQPMLVQQLVEKKGENNAQLISVARVTWALLLRTYTGLERVCFSYEETGGSDEITENVILLDIDGEMPVYGLLESAATNAVPMDREYQYNTSVLVRFGTQPGKKYAAAKPMVMPDTVRRRCFVRRADLTVLVQPPPTPESVEIRTQHLSRISHLGHTDGASEEHCEYRRFYPDFDSFFARPGTYNPDDNKSLV